MVSVVGNDGLDPSEEKRDKIATRLGARGHCPCKAFIVTEESLLELERRLDEIKKLEANNERLALSNFVRGLVSKPGRRKTRQLPLQYNDLPDDPIRVKKCKIKKLENQCQELKVKLYEIDAQIQHIGNYNDSEDREANLKNDKSKKENELRTLQKELAKFKEQPPDIG
jgi:hypothetical protein